MFIINAGYISAMSHGLKGATSEGSTVLHTSFCNLSSISKYQPGAPTQTLQQYFMQGRREDF